MSSRKQIDMEVVFNSGKAKTEDTTKLSEIIITGFSYQRLIGNAKFLEDVTKLVEGYNNWHKNK